MPQRRTAIKDLRRNKTKHSHNLDIKTDLRKTIKKFVATVTAKNKAEAETLLKVVYKKIDKAIKRHVLHRNTGARRKSYYSKLLAKIAS